LWDRAGVGDRTGKFVQEFSQHKRLHRYKC
jgi:hypothetical protein